MIYVRMEPVTCMCLLLSQVKVYETHIPFVIFGHDVQVPTSPSDLWF